MSDEERIGVIFDMDGVLVDSADAHYESWRRLGREHGVEITRAQFQGTFGQQNSDIIPGLFGESDESEIRRLGERKEAIYREIVRKDPPVVHGAVALVHSLRKAGARLAVGSSGPRANVDLILGAMGVRDLVSVVVSAEDVARGKPDPEVFELAARRLGVMPRRCVVIEDAPAGARAAYAAGARCVAVLMHHPREAFDRADGVVRELADLRVDYLLSLVS